MREREGGDMKELLGSPGTVSGLTLRIGQCLFASASIGVMVSALGFSSYTAFWYDFFRFSFESLRICNFAIFGIVLQVHQVWSHCLC